MKRHKKMELVSRNNRNDDNDSEFEQLISSNSGSSSSSNLGSDPASQGGSKAQTSSSSSSSRSDNAKTLRNPARRSSQVFLLRKMLLQWKLLSPRSKWLFGILLFSVMFHVVIGTWDVLFHRYGFDPSLLQPLQPDEMLFTVVINTYKRPEMLRKAVQHYAVTCGPGAGVGQVFVVWAEQGVALPTPEELLTADTSSGLRKSGSSNLPLRHSKVKVLQVDKDSLNSRFEPIPESQSTGIFMVDDDVRVACPSLTRGFLAWKARPESMAGYYPRIASPPRADPTSTTELVYHTWPHVYVRHKFNFILTKASFLHSKYMELYTSSALPQEIKDYVDQHMNCEDVAMSLLVANYTASMNGKGVPAPPVYVEGKVQDLGLFNGISTGSGHMMTRSKCLTDLSRILRDDHGWAVPLNRPVPLRKYSWLQHRPGFWFQYRPSNFFEWFSFANSFT